MKYTLYFLLSLSLVCLLAHSAHATVHPPGGCDTLTTVEGKVYLVSDVEELWKEVRFRLCDNASRTYTMPSDRVVSIKKAKPLAVAVPKPKVKPEVTKPLLDTISWHAKESYHSGLLSLLFSITVILSPMGLIIGLKAINTANKGLKMFKGYAGYRKLRRKLWWGRCFGWLAVLLAAPMLAAFLLLIAGLLLSGSLPSFSMDFSGGGSW